VRRVACLLVPRFSAAAIIRMEPALAGQPLVVLGDTAPARLVIEATDSARAQGARPGMTGDELLAEPRTVICRERSLDGEVAAHGALLEVALAHSPRVEDGGPGLAYLDVAGLQGLFGDESQIARRLFGAARAHGLEARVGIAGSRAGALLVARSARDVAAIPPGGEAEALAPAPLALLDLPPETAHRLVRWGVRTVGELAALPSRALFERMGEEGLALQRLARGEDPRPLRPYEPPPAVEEGQEMDGPVETLASVHALLDVLAERIGGALMRRHRAADRLEWTCLLADGAEHAGQVVPVFPTRDPVAIGTLLRAAVDARPPHAPVTGVRVRACPVYVPPGQESFDGPRRPNPRHLAETLARLGALVGAKCLGTPVILDTHRPDAVRLDPFTLPAGLMAPPRRVLAKAGDTRGGGSRPEAGPGPTAEEQPAAHETTLDGGAAPAGPPRPVEVEMKRADEASAMPSVVSGRWSLGLRRLRPPRRAAVTLVGGRPVHLRAEGCAGRIVASAGPWRSSGEWWGEARWARDEWDVELQDGTLCRLVTDGRGWSVEAIYD
jgi:protein ImuB